MLVVLSALFACTTARGPVFWQVVSVVQRSQGQVALPKLTPAVCL